MHNVRRIMLVASAALVFTALAGCSASLQKGSPEAAVDSLLRLRSELATDPADYASYVDTSMAEALAQDSASRTATQTAPTPEWNTPESTSEDTATAKVTVRWKTDSDFPSWAKATVFELEKTGGRWIVVDAETVRSGGATSTP